MLKTIMQLFCCVAFLSAGCSYTGEKKMPVGSNKKKDSTIIRRQAIKKVPVNAQSKPYKGQYCFIKKTYTQGNTSYIEADYIQFLMGKEAIEAATKKGEADAVQDDYYVVNDNAKTRRLDLSKNVLIQLVITEDGKSFFTNGTDSMLHKKLKEGIFVLQFEHGIVTEIKEQFLP